MIRSLQLVARPLELFHCHPERARRSAGSPASPFLARWGRATECESKDPYSLSLIGPYRGVLPEKPDFRTSSPPKIICGIIHAATVLVLFLALALSVAAQTQRKPAMSPTSKPAHDERLYSNITFGFRYRIPFGWVDRTKELHEQTAGVPAAVTAAGAGTGQSNAKKEDAAAGQVFLAIFERPPEAAGDTVNSAVVIAAESAAAYPGLKKAEDYLGPLTELTAAKGFKAAEEPSPVEIEGRELVRADFAKPLTDKLTMHQSTLILLAKGQIISFTFIAGSEDEIDNLINGLHFQPKSGAH